MADGKIKFVGTPPKILFADGKIVFNCACCKGGCQYCLTGGATPHVEITGVVQPMFSNCADCTLYNSTDFDWVQPNPDICFWRGEPPCYIPDFDPPTVPLGIKMELYIVDIGGGMVRIQFWLYADAFDEVEIHFDVAVDENGKIDCSTPRSGAPTSYLPVCDWTGANITIWFE